jgi:hypothetical protein
MKTKKSPPEKKYFTVAEANAALPLAQAIVRDITALARNLRERHAELNARQERLARLKGNERTRLGQAYEEELRQVAAEFEREKAEFERDQERMSEYVKELTDLGILLKDYDTGLLDFPCWSGGREVYLCWQLGEAEVAHWHEINAGFKGRREITPDFAGRQRAESRSASN